MSELRDLTASLRSIANRQTGIEECLLVVLRNSEQEADWRHEQRNMAQRMQLEGEERDRALKQVQEACGAITHKLAEVVERLDNAAATRLSDVKELRDRVRQIELRRNQPDEATQP